jgi:Cu/Ag efflux pump CusA
VVLIFEQRTDLMRARQLVQERVAQLGSLLPAAARPPVMLSPLSSTSRAMKIGLWSEKLSQMELSELARWTIRPRLMSVPGVANVAIWGQKDRQIQVLVDPDRLRAHHLTLDRVVQAAREAAAVGAGGYLDTPNQRLAVSHISPIAGAQDLARIAVAHRNGASLRLGDVADVVESHPPPIGDAIINDVPGILLIVEKQPWGNTLDVTHKVEAALDALRPGLTDVHVDSTIFRPATFIEMSLANLSRAALIGCLLVIGVLAFFLYDWRSALISVLAIPLSVVAAALVLFYRGGTIDTMVIAGLVIALGAVVDDAIIDVENIVRRLRLNRAAGSPQSPFQVVLSASLEVRSAIVYASLIIALVFVPVFLLDGLAGSFFRPLALSYILAIAASLAVALTVTPALSLLLLAHGPLRSEDPPLVARLKRRYREILPLAIDRPQRALRWLGAALGVTALAYPFHGEEFLPHFKEYDILCTGSRSRAPRSRR